MNAIDLQQEYDFINQSNDEWLKQLEVHHKAQIAILLNKYANKLNKTCVSSCYNKKLPVMKISTFNKAWGAIKDGNNLERKIFEAGYRIGIKEYRKLNNC